MESVAKLCAECTHYISGDCAGKAQSECRKDGKPPCGKYQLYAGEDLDAEPSVKDDEQLKAVLEPETIKSELMQAEPANDEPETTSEPTRQRAGRVIGGAKSLEQRQADFQRILAKRLPKAIAAIASIGHLSNKYAYSWTKDDLARIRVPIIDALGDVLDKLDIFPV